jgi:hypothetical protein
MIPAKCRDEILRCGGSVWAGIVMKHHNTPTKHATSLVSFCVHPLASSAPSVNTISENEVYRTQFREEETWYLWKMQEKWRNGESSVLLIFSATTRIKCSLTTDGRPLRGSSCIFSRLSLKCLTHPLTIEPLMEHCPYTTQSWRWMSPGYMLLEFKKRITDHISHVAGFAIFLNILNTQDDE